MILSRNMLKRVGESRHPCRTPTVVQNQSPMLLLLKRTALVALSQRFLMTRIRFVLQYGLKHDFAWVTDEANCSVVLTLLQVAFLGKCDD